MNTNMKKTLSVIFFCVCTLLLSTGCAAVRHIQNTPGQLNINITGKHEIFLEYGSTYEEEGALATYSDSEATSYVPVTLYGNVDTNKIGSYMITYTAEAGGITRTTYRRVHVVDTVAPTITLHTQPGHTTLPGAAYVDEGFLAYDNYDGDISEQVSRTEANGIVTYSVSDSSGNTATATREIRYYEPNPPVLSLSGNNYLVLQRDTEFADPGYTATDDTSGDLTDSVSVTGHVDTGKAGIYTLTYSVADEFGNTSTANRTVYVLPNLSGDDPHIEKNGSVVYLTFDDGPSNHTSHLLDVLAQYNVKATFFVVNTGNIGIISRVAAEGHTVAVHTTSHRFEKIYSSDEAYIADLQNMQSIIYEHTGQWTTMFRFPGGSSNDISSSYNIGIMSRLTKTLPEMGYQYYDWNVDSRDSYDADSAEEVFYNVINGIDGRGTSIVLQHDIHKFSVDAVEQIIAWGLCNGYTFLPLQPGSPTVHHLVYN